MRGQRELKYDSHVVPGKAGTYDLAEYEFEIHTGESIETRKALSYLQTKHKRLLERDFSYWK